MIGVLIFPDFQLLDAAGPISVFEIAARLSKATPAIKTLAATPSAVRSTSGVEMLARGLKPSSAITTLIIAGGEGVRAASACPKTLAFVRAVAKRGVRVASVCSGAHEGQRLRAGRRRSHALAAGNDQGRDRAGRF